MVFFPYINSHLHTILFFLFLEISKRKKNSFLWYQNQIYATAIASDSYKTGAFFQKMLNKQLLTGVFQQSLNTPITNINNYMVFKTFYVEFLVNRSLWKLLHKMTYVVIQ